MMRLAKCCLLGLVLTFFSVNYGFSQFFGFQRCDSILVIDNIASANDTLKLAWSGGISQGEISTIDLDSDGILDIFAFDRIGNRFILLRNNGTPGIIDYSNWWKDYENFPKMSDWVLLRDYNGDGKNDLFFYWNGGSSVYKNTSTPGGVSFELVKSQIFSNYNPNNIVLYISAADVPAISDIDNDGDLDILTYGFSSGCIEYHKNLSMETYGNADSLNFKLSTDNWGHFTEGVSLSDITLNDSCDTVRFNSRHTGSTTLAIDMDNDGDKDLVVGDAGSNRLAYIRNGGDSNLAVMDLFDVSFPQNYSSTVPADFSLFLGAYFLDVNNDNAKDLIVCNNATGSAETENSIWRYTNQNTTLLPDFKFMQNDFLQSEMIEFGEGAYPVLFDYNLDGLVDLAVGNATYFSSNGQIAVFRNVGTSSQPVFELVSKDMGAVSGQSVKNIAPTFGDMDGDGDMDMIIGETTGYIHYYENTAPVLANQPANYVLTTTQYFNIKENSFSAPFIIDLNMDGKLDIVCGSRLGKLNYYQNTGSTTVPNFSSTPTITDLGGVSTVDPTFSSSGYSVPWFFQNNGKWELFLGSYSGKIYHYTNLYDGANNIESTFTLQTPSVNYFKDGFRSAVTVGYFNADNYPDMIYGQLSGGVDLLYGKYTEVGIEEFTDNKNKFLLYPNPSDENGIVYIQSNKEWNTNFDLRIIDLSGRVVQHLKEINIHQGINVSHLSRGLYIFELYADQHLASKLKCIKQ